MQHGYELCCRLYCRAVEGKKLLDWSHSREYPCEGACQTPGAEMPGNVYPSPEPQHFLSAMIT